MWKHVFHQLLIGSPVKGLTQQDEPELRRVHGAIVRTKRHFAGAGHLTFTILMQYLARLFIAPVVLLLALVQSQHAQRLSGELWIQHERLVRGNDGVAAEHGGKPGDTGGNYALFGLWNLQRVKISFARVYHRIENAIARMEAAGV